MIHKVSKPTTCFYCDYVVDHNRLYAIFETEDDRVHKKYVCNLRAPIDYKKFEITESENELIFKINE